MGSLPNDLARPELTLVETHISWVFLGAQEVWKVKKPVNFGFLDFCSREQRRAACEAEVRLNRRLAPDVYLGVVPITAGGDGKMRLGGEGPPVDYAVHMRRLSEPARADVRLATGQLDAEDIDEVAITLARFHGDSAPLAAEAQTASVDFVAQNIRENFGQTRGLIERHLEPAQARELEEWQLGFIDRNIELLHARATAGRVRDGHGDLRLEHVYFEPPGAVTIIDCIEFNERFRLADVCCDLAFLAMDLAYHDRVDLSERLLATYAREANDYDLYRLVDFYQSYRAHVRAKVSLLLAADPAVSPTAREAARQQARRYFLLALAEERRALAEPAVIAVGGIIASGKSTIATHIGARLGAPVIASDHTRKFLAGVDPERQLGTSHFSGAYAPERTEQVYSELWERAGAVLSSGRSVVLDASFRAQRHRDAARALAERHGLPFYFVECQAPEQQLRQRLAARARAPGHVSDAREDLLSAFAARWEPEATLPAGQHLLVDTTAPTEVTIERLGEALPFWPAPVA